MLMMNPVSPTASIGGRRQTSESLTRAAISDGRRSPPNYHANYSPYRYMLFSDEAIRVRNHTAANKQTKSNSGRSTRLVARTGRNPPMGSCIRITEPTPTPNHDQSGLGEFSIQEKGKIPHILY